jgi:MYXO-CTERM domain-containing protein
VIIIDKEPTIVIEQDGGGTGEGCSVSPNGRPGILLLLGLFAFAKRRRKKE